MKGRLGRSISALSGAALLVALYLTWTKLTGTAPVCAVGGGCETVATSPFASLLGVPVAAFGVAGSAATLAGAIAWWRRGLLAAYLIGLVSLPILAYLFFLEVAVIHAICTWCVTYALLTIGAWLTASAALLVREPGAATTRR
jgi:uncharacterized membrane protein